MGYIIPPYPTHQQLKYGSPHYFMRQVRRPALRPTCEATGKQADKSGSIVKHYGRAAEHSGRAVEHSGSLSGTPDAYVWLEKGFFVTLVRTARFPEEGITAETEAPMSKIYFLCDQKTSIFG